VPSAAPAPAACSAAASGASHAEHRLGTAAAPFSGPQAQQSGAKRPAELGIILHFCSLITLDKLQVLQYNMPKKGC